MTVAVMPPVGHLFYDLTHMLAQHCTDKCSSANVRKTAILGLHVSVLCNANTISVQYRPLKITLLFLQKDDSPVYNTSCKSLFFLNTWLHFVTSPEERLSLGWVCPFMTMLFKTFLKTFIEKFIISFDSFWKFMSIICISGFRSIPCISPWFPIPISSPKSSPWLCYFENTTCLFWVVWMRHFFDVDIAFFSMSMLLPPYILLFPHRALKMEEWSKQFLKNKLWESL